MSDERLDKVTLAGWGCNDGDGGGVTAGCGVCGASLNDVDTVADVIAILADHECDPVKVEWEQGREARQAEADARRKAAYEKANGPEAAAEKRRRAQLYLDAMPPVAEGWGSSWGTTSVPNVPT